MHDELTGLDTRRAFLEQLSMQTRTCLQEHRMMGLLIVKLLNLRTINATYGHAAGDLVLAQFARRVTGILRDNDRAARIGASKFGIILGTLASNGHSILAANKIQSLANEPFVLDDEYIEMEACIGISLLPAHASKADYLFNQAEHALHTAITSKAAYSIFDPDITESDTDQLLLTQELKRAIYNDELIMHYQPQIDLHNQQVCGVEALVRWKHPDKGLVPPDRFISVAEKSNLIDSLTMWTLNTSLRHCSQCSPKRKASSISLNLSASLLHDLELIDTIRSAMEIWGIPHEKVIFEVTESAMMIDPDLSMNVLTQISELGARISIDDFGTGYSSLAYLKQLPVDELKIDKSFVLKMAENESDHKIVRSIIDLAHTFDMSVVAEGIENEKTLELLTAMGCDIGQGYYIARPMPLEKIREWMGVTHYLDEKITST